MPHKMKQEADYPDALLDLVGDVHYKEGWTFHLSSGYDRGQGSIGCLDSSGSSGLPNG